MNVTDVADAVLVHSTRAERPCLWRTTWGRWCLDRDPGAGPGPRVTATYRGRMVGSFCYGMRRGRKLRAMGTWVHPRWQGRGVALTMWAVALHKETPRRVEVRCVSDRGRTLIQAVARRYPGIQWDVEEDGERKLRILPGKGKGKDKGRAA